MGGVAGLTGGVMVGRGIARSRILGSVAQGTGAVMGGGGYVAGPVGVAAV